MTEEVALFAAQSARGVATALLPGNQHRAERRSVGNGAARHAAERDRGHNGGRQLAAGPALHALGRELQQLAAQVATHHQRAGQHEERQREHRKRLRLIEHLLDNASSGTSASPQHRDSAAG